MDRILNLTWFVRAFLLLKQFGADKYYQTVCWSDKAPKETRKQTWCGLTDSQRSRGRWLILCSKSFYIHPKPDGASIQKNTSAGFPLLKTEGRESCWRGEGRVYVWALAASLAPSFPSLVCLCLGSLCLALAPEPTHTSAPLPTPWTRCLKSSGGSASYAWEKGMSYADKRRLSEPGRKRFLRSVSLARTVHQ